MAREIMVVEKQDINRGGAPEPSIDLVVALYEVNGDAGRFTLTPESVVEAAVKAEGRLDEARLPQGKRLGFTVRARSAGPAARAYKYSAAGTEVIMRRTKRGWVLVDASRVRVFPTQVGSVSFAAPKSVISEIQRRSVLDIYPLD